MENNKQIALSRSEWTTVLNAVANQAYQNDSPQKLVDIYQKMQIQLQAQTKEES